MFSLDRFNNSISEFLRTKEGGLSYQEFKEEGIRIVLELFKFPKIDEMRAQISNLLGREISLEPMFPNAEDFTGERIYNTGNFLLLTIYEGVYEAVDKQIFDLAYYLREELDLRSAEPDIPFKRYDIDQLKSGSGCREPDNGEPFDYAWSLRNMDIPSAWSLIPSNIGKIKGSGVRIGHPDTGYSDHIDLDKNRLDLTSGYDFVSNKSDPKDPLDYHGKLMNPGHGTATGSVMVSSGSVSTAPTGSTRGGTTPPGKVTGVAPEAILIPYRAIKSVARIFSSNVARAVYRATQNDCHIISMSLGGFPSRSLHAAIEDAINRQVIVLAAAGNCVGIVVWPAKFKNCIALAATNISDKPWKGSSHGTEVAVSAPGEYVWCARRKSSTDTSYDLVDGGQGTSFATANAAGVAALWLAFHNRNRLISLCNQNGVKIQYTFKELLQSTARVPSPSWISNEYGSGIINAHELLQASVYPVQTPLNAYDYAYIGHIASLLESSNIKNLIKLFQKLFPSPFTAKDDQLLWSEVWGHELLIIIINNDILRNKMMLLLSQDISSDSYELIFDDVRSIIKEDASITLANFLGKIQ